MYLLTEREGWMGKYLPQGQDQGLDQGLDQAQ